MNHHQNITWGLACWTAVKVREWVSNYIGLLYVDWLLIYAITRVLISLFPVSTKSHWKYWLLVNLFCGRRDSDCNPTKLSNWLANYRIGVSVIPRLQFEYDKNKILDTGRKFAFQHLRLDNRLCIKHSQSPGEFLGRVLSASIWDQCW